MSGALRDYRAERTFIETSDDPAEILGWMQEYRAERREADDDDRAELDALIEFAEDRVVALKAARLAPKPAPQPAPTPAAPSVAPAPAAPNRLPEVRRTPVTTLRHPVAPLRPVETQPRPTVSPLIEADDPELRELRDRARKARLRQAAAEAETARLAEERAAAERERARMEQERARRRDQARRDAQEQERIAAAAEAKAKAAAQSRSVAASPAQTLQAPRSTLAAVRPGATPARVLQRPEPAAIKAAASADSTPLSRVFEEALSRDVPRTPRPTPDRAAGTPSPSRTPSEAPTSAPAASTQPSPVDELPPLTGADLIKFREWLGVSQRALAAKFGVEQGTVSKGEGKPAAVLGPALRAALHTAMGEPRDAVGRGS